MKFKKWKRNCTLLFFENFHIITLFWQKSWNGSYSYFIDGKANGSDEETACVNHKAHPNCRQHSNKMDMLFYWHLCATCRYTLLSHKCRLRWPCTSVLGQNVLARTEESRNVKSSSSRRYSKAPYLTKYFTFSISIPISPSACSIPFVRFSRLR